MRYDTFAVQSRPRLSRSTLDRSSISTYAARFTRAASPRHTGSLGFTCQDSSTCVQKAVFRFMFRPYLPALGIQLTRSSHRIISTFCTSIATPRGLAAMNSDVAPHPSCAEPRLCPQSFVNSIASPSFEPYFKRLQSLRHSRRPHRPLPRRPSQRGPHQPRIVPPPRFSIRVEKPIHVALTENIQADLAVDTGSQRTSSTDGCS